MRRHSLYAHPVRSNRDTTLSYDVPLFPDAPLLSPALQGKASHRGENEELMRLCVVSPKGTTSACTARTLEQLLGQVRSLMEETVL